MEPFGGVESEVSVCESAKGWSAELRRWGERFSKRFKTGLSPRVRYVDVKTISNVRQHSQAGPGQRDADNLIQKGTERKHTHTIVVPVRGFGERVSRQETQWVSYSSQDSSFHRGEVPKGAFVRKNNVRLVLSRRSTIIFHVSLARSVRRAESR